MEIANGLSDHVHHAVVFKVPSRNYVFLLLRLPTHKILVMVEIFLNEPQSAALRCSYVVCSKY